MKLDTEYVWGMDLEIHAAASLWQVPTQHFRFFVCFKPLSSSEIVCPDEYQQLPRPPGVLHFEVFYASKCHYVVIIGADGHVPDYLPIMSQPEETYITL